MNNNLLLTQLNDCFTGGYTLPQYCIDNNIERPLIVAEKKFLPFVWQIHTQFCFDKRLKAQFSFRNKKAFEVNYSIHHTIPPLRAKAFSEVSPEEFDKIIVLSSDKNSVPGNNTVFLDKLCNYFFAKPIMKFLC